MGPGGRIGGLRAGLLLLAAVLATGGLLPRSGGAASSVVSLSISSTHPVWVGNQAYQYYFQTHVTNTGSESSGDVVVRQTIDSEEQWLEAVRFLSGGGSAACTGSSDDTQTTICDVGALAPGQTADMSFYVRVNGSSTGQLNHTASASDGPASTSEADTIELRDASTSDMYVTYNGSTVSEIHGVDQANWHVWAGGPSDPENATVRITVPPDVEITTLETDYGSCDITTAICDLGSLTGLGAQITLFVSGAENESVTLTATASTTSPDPDLSNNTSSITMTTCCPPAGGGGTGSGGGGAGGSGGGGATPVAVKWVAALPHAVVNHLYNVRLVVDPPSGFSAALHTGRLPYGIYITPSGGLSGVPVSPGSLTFTVNAVFDNFQSAAPPHQFTLVIDNAPSTQTVVRASAALTPGSLDPRVTQTTIRSTICSPSWHTHPQPTAGFLRKLKSRQMRQYHDVGPASAYGEDALVPVGLGGSASAPANLWPELLSLAKRRDLLEQDLNRQVCSGKTTLRAARQRIVGLKRRAG